MKKFRTMRKIFAFILALTLVLGMSAVAFAGEAADESPPEGDYITVEAENDGDNNLNSLYVNTVYVKKVVEGKLRIQNEGFKMDLYKWGLFSGWKYQQTMTINKDQTKSFGKLEPGFYQVREDLTPDQAKYYGVNVVHNKKTNTAIVTNTAQKEVYGDWDPITIKKELVVNNEGTLNPAETFKFAIGAGTGEKDGKAIDAPAFNPNTFTITVPQGGNAGSADITLPEFTRVGVYTYEVTEIAGNTAGMDYDGDIYKLVVTVINNPDFGEVEGAPKFLRVLTLTDGNNVKDDTFNNDFDAGELVINKVTTGNFTDPDDEFEVTVTLTPQAGKVLVDDAILADGNTSYSQDPATGVVTIKYTVKAGSAYTIKNIPYDVDYKVTEVKADKYDDPIYDGNQEGPIDDVSVSTTITNNRDTTIETGINLDNLPYMLIIVVVAGSLIGFTVRKRSTNRR